MFTDMENAELLVVWGAKPGHRLTAAGHARRLEATARRGCEIVVIDPRRPRPWSEPGPDGCPSVPVPTAHWRSV